MAGERPSLAHLELAEDPDAWAAFGFAVEDGRCVVGSTEIVLSGGDGGIAAWALAGCDGAADGLAVVPAAANCPGPAAHPNGAVAIDHVVVATPDTQRTFAALEAAGLPLRRTRDGGSAERPLRQGFFVLRDALVEVVGPPAPAGDGPAVFWGLTVVVADLDATAALLAGRIGAVKQAVQPGRRIATAWGRQAGLRTPLAFMSPRV